MKKIVKHFWIVIISLLLDTLLGCKLAYHLLLLHDYTSDQIWDKSNILVLNLFLTFYIAMRAFDNYSNEIVEP